MKPVLIPLLHLDGFMVWIGNDWAGSTWRDKWGVRWTLHNVPGRQFRYGITDDITSGVTMIMDAYRHNS